MKDIMIAPFMVEMIRFFLSPPASRLWVKSMATAESQYSKTA